MPRLLETGYPKVQFFQPEPGFWDHAGRVDGPPQVPPQRTHIGQAGLKEDFSAPDCDRRQGTPGFWFLVRFNGPIRLWRNGSWQEAPAGSTVLWAPGQRHRYGTEPGRTIHHDYLFVRGRSVDALARSLALHTDQVLAGVAPEPFAAHLHALIQELLRESPNELIVDHSVSSLLLTVAGSGQRPEPGDARLHFIRRRLEIEFARSHTLAGLAREVHLSPSYLNACFSRLVGQPPIAYLIDLRLRRACELLRGTDLPIKEVAVQVGYQDQYFFSRIFRRRQGVSPRGYRLRAPRPLSS